MLYLYIKLLVHFANKNILISVNEKKKGTVKVKLLLITFIPFFKKYVNLFYIIR